MFILNLIQNITLLIALAALYQVIAARLRKESLGNKVVSGVLFGVVAIVGMMTPVHFTPGIIFDGRSIILSIGGLLGGPVVALVSAVPAGIFRAHLGGVGAYVGIATIIVSAALGVLFHYIWNVKGQRISLIKLWLFGILVNSIMLMIFLGLPGSAGTEVVRQMGLAILVFYPIATVLVCQLFLDYERQISNSRALHESESLYRGIFENAAAGVDIVNEKGEFLQVNNTFCQILGYSRDELLKFTIFDVTHPEDRDISNLKHQQMIQGETDSYKFVKRYMSKDGRVVWAEVSVAAVYREDGSYQSTIGVISDITAKKLSEDALKERERMWEMMIGNLPGFVYRCANDRNWTMEYISSGCLEITGYSPEDFIMNRTLAFNDIVSPEYSEELWNRWQQVISNKALFEEEYPITNRDGRIRWVWERGRGIFDERGKLLFLEGFITDVTERRETELALRESHQRYQNLFEKSRLQEELYLSMLNCSADPIIVYDMEGRVRYLNPAHTELFGWSLEEVEGKKLATVPAWDIEKTKSIIDQILQTGKTNRSYETQRMTKDGRSVDVSISGSRYLDHNGLPAGMLVIIQDISHRKKVQELQRRLVTAIEQAAEAVIITDSSAEIKYVNPAFEKITGYSSAEVIGKTPSILKSGIHDENFYRRLWETIQAGEVWSGRFINRKKDGSIYYEDATISPVRDFKGNINNFVGVKRDVTETVELTRQLLHSQKMEAVGTLAGGIAHDFNNLLQVVMGYCEIMLHNRDRNESDRADLEKIYFAGKKGAELVRKLLTFSRNEQAKPVPVNVNDEITQIRDLLSRTIPKNIQIELRLSPDLSLVEADPSQLSQVILNLSVNARDAMQDGGKLSIETKNIFLDEDYCNKNLGVAPGKHVCLIVSDTGSGIDESVIDHIFEPFFSTKEVGKGTGLGLATVYGIVKNHGGHITCESLSGEGSTFKIYFPAINSET